jgi:hypothetical protein
MCQVKEININTFEHVVDKGYRVGCAGCFFESNAISKYGDIANF